MRMDIRSEELFTKEELCRKLKITRQTLYRYQKKGLAPQCIMVLGQERFSSKEINRWLKQNNPAVMTDDDIDPSLIAAALAGEVSKETKEKADD